MADHVRSSLPVSTGPEAKKCHTLVDGVNVIEHNVILSNETVALC